MTVEIGEAGVEDIEALVGLWVALARYNVAIGQRRPLRRQGDVVEVVRRKVGEAMASPATDQIFVAFSEQDVVGLCHAGIRGRTNRWLTFTPEGKSYEIDRHPRHRPWTVAT